MLLMERWGLGYEGHLSERFPRLIYCAISGFGADGPLGGLPGYDAVLQAMGFVVSQGVRGRLTWADWLRRNDPGTRSAA